MNPKRSMELLLTMLGFADVGNTYEFVSENFVILKRGAFFIEETMERVNLSIP